MTKRKKETSSLRPAFYFGFLVAFITVVSLFFKAADIIRESKFDGGNQFTTAVLGGDNVGLILVSPKEGTLMRVKIEGISSEEELWDLALPYEGTIESKIHSDTKSFFAKILLRPGKKTNLTILDLLRLSLYSFGIDKSKIKDEALSAKALSENSNILDLLEDPVIGEEKVTITITNSTKRPGLGNRLAKYIIYMGGNVVLVNSAQKEENKSKIFYQKESYTLKKISKMLNIPKEKNNKNSISDITIIIGKDWRDI